MPPRSRKRVVTPVVLQSEHAECGAAALAIVLAHYGRWISVESLRVECGVSRDGSNAASIVQVARRHGLEANGYRTEPPDFTEFGFPCIVHWNFNHFVVLEGQRGKKYFINDPASGRRTVDRTEVEKAFTGVVLAFEKSTDFEPLGKRPNWWRSLKGYLAEVDHQVLLVFLLGLATIVPGMLTPIITRVFIDDVLIDQYTDWLRPLLIGLLVNGLLLGVLAIVQGQMMLILQTRFSVALNSRFMQQALSLPLRFFAQRSAGDLASRPQLITRLGALVSGPLGRACTGWITTFCYLAVMFYYDSALSLGVLVIFLFNVYFLLWQARQLETINQVLVRERTRYSGAAMQSLQMLPEIKAMGGETGLYTKLLGHKARLANQLNKLTASQSLLAGLSTFTKTISTALLLLIGGYRVMGGEMTLGVFVAFQGLMLQFMQPLQQMLTLFGELQETQGTVDKIEDITRYRDRDNIDWDYTKPAEGKLRPSLALDKVTFGYQPLAPPLLEDFDLRVEPGQWVALVGASGSGKSTVARLVARLVDPWSGTVRFGGKDIDTLSSTELRSSLAIVDQKIVLFSGTIAENLSVWDQGLDDDRMVRAAKAAEIHDWITRRPNGFDNRLTENGANLSGGEKARLEIARALATEPTFMVLDEATAALDPITERKVIDNIRASCAGGILITHRIASAAFCDEIIVFDGGKPVQRGTYAELIAEAHGPFADLLAEEAA